MHDCEIAKRLRGELHRDREETVQYLMSSHRIELSSSTVKLACLPCPAINSHPIHVTAMVGLSDRATNIVAACS